MSFNTPLPPSSPRAGRRTSLSNLLSAAKTTAYNTASTALTYGASAYVDPATNPSAGISGKKETLEMLEAAGGRGFVCRSNTVLDDEGR